VLNNDRIDFEGKSIILIPNNVVHGFEWKKDIEGKVISIDTNYFIDLFFDFADLFRFFGEPKIISKIPENIFCRLKHITDNILSELENKQVFTDRIVKNLLEFLTINMFRDFFYNKSIIDGKNLSEVKVYNQFRSLLIKYEQNRNDLGFFTKNLNVSLGKLNKACTFVTGKPAHNSITEQVLCEAKMLLTISDLSIANISEKLHFSNQNYFSRFFKKHTKLTPIEFRKKSAISTIKEGNKSDKLTENGI